MEDVKTKKKTKEVIGFERTRSNRVNMQDISTLKVSSVTKLKYGELDGLKYSRL